MNTAIIESLGKALFEDAGDAMFLLDPARNCLLDANPTAGRLTGFRREELRGMAFAHLIDYPQPEQWQALLQAIKKAGSFTAREGFRLRTARQGVCVPVTLTVSRLRVRTKILTLVVARDLRKQREAFERLGQVEEQLQRVLALVTDAVWSASCDAHDRWTFSYASPALARIAGQPREVFHDRLEMWWRVIHPEDRRRARQEYERLRHSAPPAVADVEYRVVWPDGSVRWVRDRVRVSRDPHSQLPRLDGVLSDVTERRLAEERLHFQAQVLAQLSDTVVAVDSESRVTYWNRAAEQLSGVPAAQALGRPITDVLPPEVLAALGPDLCAVAETGQPRQCEYPATVGGEARRFEARLVAVPASGVLTLVRDITERHRAEAGLAQSEARFRALFERHGSVMLLLDPAEDRIIDANPAAEQFYGYGRDELRRLSVTALNPFAPEQIRAALARADEGRQHHFLMEHRLACGDQRLVEVYASPINAADGRPLLFAIIHDLTERQKLEDRLRQVQKLEAIGRLAGGVAHDFNNLMTAVNGYSSLLLAKLPADGPLREYASEVGKAGERAAGLTRQLLAFSRQSPARPAVLDLNQVARGMMKMLGRLVGDNHRLSADLADGLWPVKADLGQTEQVFLNLVTNARDALPPEGGAVVIATANVTLSDDMVPARPEVQPGPYVCLTVRDTGCGMDRETLGRIFEPFFTTKPVGQGTGLGLATVYGIVKQAGGYIYADSVIGQGTTVTVFLPRAAEPVTATVAPAPAPATLPRGTGTVLLAEDEDGVRNLVGTILAACGYTVLRAADGKQALAAVAGHSRPIDLVVTDVVMPGLTGPQMVAELRKSRPGLKVLYISGHMNPQGDGEPSRLDGRLLPKPFTPAMLAQAVREVLDGKGT